MEKIIKINKYFKTPAGTRAYTMMNPLHYPTLRYPQSDLSHPNFYPDNIHWHKKPLTERIEYYRILNIGLCHRRRLKIKIALPTPTLRPCETTYLHPSRVSYDISFAFNSLLIHSHSLATPSPTWSERKSCKGASLAIRTYVGLILPGPYHLNHGQSSYPTVVT
jgi:hypothetical protein